jgi:hypothetical protein
LLTIIAVGAAPAKIPMSHDPLAHLHHLTLAPLHLAAWP